MMGLIFLQDEESNFFGGGDDLCFTIICRRTILKFFAKNFSFLK